MDDVSPDPRDHRRATMTDSDIPLSPIVEREVDRALSIYRELLPTKVLDMFEHVLSSVLTSHPAGIGLVARLEPGLRVEVDMPADARARGFQGFSFTRVLRATLGHLAKKERAAGGVEFIASDGSLLVLGAFLEYFSYDESIMQLSDEEAVEMIGMFCDSCVGAMFLGLMQEIRSRSALKEWGETGRELLEVKARALSVLRRATGAMPDVERRFLEVYGTCRWDAKQGAKRFRAPVNEVHEACLIAMRMLGVALREELDKGDIRRSIFK